MVSSSRLQLRMPDADDATLISSSSFDISRVELLELITRCRRLTFDSCLISAWSAATNLSLSSIEAIELRRSLSRSCFTVSACTCSFSNLPRSAASSASTRLGLDLLLPQLAPAFSALSMWMRAVVSSTLNAADSASARASSCTA